MQIPVIPTWTLRRFQILDITLEVIHDYHQVVPDEGPLEYDDGRDDGRQAGQMVREEDATRLVIDMET